MNKAEIERLVMLVEECGEVIQAASKILRHGYDSGHPDTDKTNSHDLHEEIVDLYAVVSWMADCGDLDQEGIEQRVVSRVDRKLKYTHYQAQSIM